MASPVAPGTSSPATPPPSSRPSSPSPSTNDKDWAVTVADTIDSVVGSVRDKTAVPAETVVRGLVYGILIAVVGTTAMVLLTTGLVRLLDLWLRIWAVYAIVGGLFTLAGLFLWRKRRPTRS